MEKIICSAIHWNDDKKHVHQPKNITIGIVVGGHRHSNCFAILSAIATARDRKGKVTQGFLTSVNRFVDREEAAEIASKYGVIVKTKLYSEDLY